MTSSTLQQLSTPTGRCADEEFLISYSCEQFSPVNLSIAKIKNSEKSITTESLYKRTTPNTEQCFKNERH